MNKRYLPELFIHRLTSYSSQKYSRNIFNLFKCTFMDSFFQKMINLRSFSLCMRLDSPRAKN